MKKTAILFLLFTSFAMTAQEKKEKPKTQIVEASCGQCQFGMKGNGCTLAVRIDGKPYFVDGTVIDKHGDAHASDGFCNAIRKAEVAGEIVNDRFVASTFQLIEQKKATKQ
ncbi:DUF6370 family protein [Flavobacterium sp.]|uniref:DUF6370 family protein n=1 Tax=Flavobacterium sp. TaxID=239 RepID=UPI003D6C64F1